MMATSLKIDDEMKGRIQQLTSVRDRSAHWIMREAFKEYLDREEQRESFKRDARDAWDAYRSSGLHVTANEADEWLATLEAGADAEQPACLT